MIVELCVLTGLLMLTVTQYGVVKKITTHVLNHTIYTSHSLCSSALPPHTQRLLSLNL